jgi:hypothetical protein
VSKKLSNLSFKDEEKEDENSQLDFDEDDDDVFEKSQRIQMEKLI